MVVDKNSCYVTIVKFLDSKVSKIKLMRRKCAIARNTAIPELVLLLNLLPMTKYNCTHQLVSEFISDILLFFLVLLSIFKSVCSCALLNIQCFACNVKQIYTVV